MIKRLRYALARVDRCWRFALKGSFDALRKAGQSGNGIGSYLLRFYAVECGLKAAVLARRKARSTAQLPQELRSHDLRALAQELRLPPKACLGIAACSRPGDTVRVQPHQVHEAWRYGARLITAEEKNFVAGLDVLIEWCRKELRL